MGRWKESEIPVMSIASSCIIQEVLVIRYNLHLPYAIMSGGNHVREVAGMETKLQMIYWKGDKFWVGKLLEHPEIMTQGETLEELEENMKDAYMLMTMEDVPEKHKVKELSLPVLKEKTLLRSE